MEVLVDCELFHFVNHMQKSRTAHIARPGFFRNDRENRLWNVQWRSDAKVEARLALEDRKLHTSMPSILAGAARGSR